MADLKFGKPNWFPSIKDFKQSKWKITPGKTIQFSGEGHLEGRDEVEIPWQTIGLVVLFGAIIYLGYTRGFFQNILNTVSGSNSPWK